MKTLAVASVRWTGQKYTTIYVWEFSMPDGKPKGITSITSCQAFPRIIWDLRLTRSFPTAYCHLYSSNLLPTSGDISEIWVIIRAVIITCCFRTDASKIRLPLGPPISSLSQGVRSSMEHKVGHHSIGFMYQHQEGPRYNCNWITRYVFMCHQCAIKVIATKANIQLW